LMGERGLLRFVTSKRYGGAYEALSVRSLCLVRERLGHASPLVELAFAMQGLGSYPLTHAGGPMADEWLPKVISGEAVAAFALTEAEDGSDLGGISTRAQRDGDAWVLSGEKVFISNAPVADMFVVFARTSDEAPSSRALSAFLVPGEHLGVSCEATAVLGGHPIGTLRLDGVRLPADHLIGDEGRGLGLALATLGRFRTSVGGAALGFAQRALDESVAHVKSRRQFGAPLSELDAVRARLGDMACLLESSRLLVYRSAMALDGGADRPTATRMGSMAKLVATESAQKVIDSAVQLHGGRGVQSDHIVARLYEEVRALRIYEGTSDIQRVLIAREVLRDASE
ncbi:MAG: acyl-CoA dehydrogenase, partial [Polyangiales bacterium]